MASLVDFFFFFFALIDFFSFSPNAEPGPRLQWTLFSYLEDVDFADNLAACRLLLAISRRNVTD